MLFQGQSTDSVQVDTTAAGTVQPDPKWATTGPQIVHPVSEGIHANWKPYLYRTALCFRFRFTAQLLTAPTRPIDPSILNLPCH